jgi:uncharacterized protein (TIGR02453 family)
MPSVYFTPATLAFLSELAQNNRREWFEDNKARYEEHVRIPALAFIEDMAPVLNAFAPRFLAIPKKVGGSLMRVHRDTRFGRDKTPYKTNIGIQFRHDAGKDVHAPGYYLHVEADSFFLGVGIWRPDAQALGMIRERIVAKPQQWLAARDDTGFRRHYTLSGESLQNPPRGYAKDHPQLEDLKRKDFIAIKTLSRKDVLSPKLPAAMAAHFAKTTPFMRFLCGALGVGFD